MNKPHKHAELIKAWADGAEIQKLESDFNIVTNTASFKWVDVERPIWSEITKYRIKPEEKKPVVRWLWTDQNGRTTAKLLTSDEQQEHYPFQDIKLEWSRTEFPA